MSKTCVACANPADDSPVAGIGREDLFTNTGEMAIHPVCGQCYADPSHRLLKVKLHFVDATSASLALDAARHLDALSREGKDLSL